MITWACIAFFTANSRCAAHVASIEFVARPKVCQTVLAYKGRKGNFFNSKLSDEYEADMRRGKIRVASAHELQQYQYDVPPKLGEKPC